jgi:hypothetical protein
VLPLSLYLLTFVLVFARRPLVPQRWWLRLQIVFVALVACLFKTANLYVMLVLHVGAMFFTAMVCHAELARRRPVAKHLTEFYLWMSVGGVVGGILAAIVAPLVFDGVYEYPLALLFGLFLRPAPERPGRLWAAFARATRLEHDRLTAKACGFALDLVLPVVLWLLLADDLLRSTLGRLLRAAVPGAQPLPLAVLEFVAFALAVTLLLVGLAGRPARVALGFYAVLFALSPDVIGKMPRDRLLRERSFFGVYAVEATTTPIGRFHFLTNGTTNHGTQNLDRPLGPTSYYSREGPAGQFFDILRTSATPPRRIGAVGLGVGTLACYVTHGQRMTFYEIDALDEEIARDPRYFTYLANAGEKVDVVIGDGRLSLTREADGALDALVVDAFSGDAIPVHLLTREAFALYFRKLSAQGLLLLHITNSYLDLLPVVGRVVADAGLAARSSIGEEPSITPGAWPSDWVVIGRSAEALARFGWITPSWPVVETDPGVPLWTDDFTDVVRVLRWNQLGSQDP